MPLSEEEQRSLAEIEAVMLREDPGLAAALCPIQARPPSWLVIGAMLCLGALLVLVVLVAIHGLAAVAVILGVASILTMIMTIVVCVLQQFHPRS